MPLEIRRQRHGIEMGMATLRLKLGQGCEERAAERGIGTDQLHQGSRAAIEPGAAPPVPQFAL
jgi:hypothetical protein